MDKVRLGIIGLGSMGMTHYNNASSLDGVEVAAVCDIDPARLAELKGRKFQNSKDLIRSGLVDAVMVVTPHYDHAPIAIDALENGLHVLVEKPVAVHVQEAQSMVNAHKDKRLVFAAMFNQRTNPAHIKLKSMMDEGELGELRRVSWIITDWFRTESYYASGGWRATWKGEGGGVLINQCPHNIDLLQWFTGMPNRLFAKVAFGKYHNIEVEDEVTALFDYPNGATGVFVTSTGEAPGTNRLELTGEKGKAVMEGMKIIFTRNKVEMSAFGKTSTDRFGAPETETVEYSFTDKGEQHLGILKNFRDAILKGTPLIACAEEGIHSLSLANAMLMSGLLKKPVDLPLNGAVFFGQLKKLIKRSRYIKPVVNNSIDSVDMSSSFK